jgi:3'(2'), 5'-bisphosphate nucleotidase
VADYAAELALAVALAKAAGERVMGFRRAGVKAETKAFDEPVTAADRDASTFLVNAIRAAFPDDAILSEEEPDDGTRLQNQRVWMIDPIDGTRDFIEGHDGFSVMIGLLDGDRPALGVMFQPVGERLYHAVHDHGAFYSEADNTARPIRVSKTTDASKLRMVASRSHRDAIVDKVAASLGIGDSLHVGSLGLKVGLIARNERDLYVNPSGKSKLWDTCGPEVILLEAGGRITNARGEVLQYRTQALNHAGIIASNGALHDEIVQKLAPFVG